MQLSRTQLMCSFRGRMRLAAEAAEAAAQQAALLDDPWLAPVSRLRGRIDHDGIERITTQQCLDALDVPLHARNHAVFFRLNQLMQAHGWEPTRISGVSSSVDTRVRGYQRKTDRVSAHLQRVSGQNRHQHALCHRQDSFASGDGQPVGFGAFGPRARG
jgi:hypothetical protein